MSEKKEDLPGLVIHTLPTRPLTDEERRNLDLYERAFADQWGEAQKCLPPEAVFAPVEKPAEPARNSDGSPTAEAKREHNYHATYVTSSEMRKEAYGDEAVADGGMPCVLPARGDKVGRPTIVWYRDAYWLGFKRSVKQTYSHKGQRWAKFKAALFFGKTWLRYKWRLLVRDYRIQELVMPESGERLIEYIVYANIGTAVLYFADDRSYLAYQDPVKRAESEWRFNELGKLELVEEKT